jgi:hypothetical protein
VNRFKQSWTVGVVAMFGFGIMGLVGAFLTIVVSGLVAWVVSALRIHGYADTEHLGWLVFGAVAMPYFLGEAARLFPKTGST